MSRKPRVQRTPEEKWQIVLEGLKSGNVAETCRKYEIAPNLEASVTCFPCMSVTADSGAGFPTSCFLILAAFHCESSFTSCIPSASLKRLTSGWPP